MGKITKEIKKKQIKKGNLMIVEFIKLGGCSILIVLISKYILANSLRNLAKAIEIKPKTIGNISGMATSIPELLTTTISGFKGLLETSIYNILSSNIINFILYISSVFVNKNQKILKNKVILIELIFVLVTIFIPIILSISKQKLNLYYAYIFIVLYLFLKLINNLVHKKYLNHSNVLENNKGKINKKKENEKLKLKEQYKINIIVKYSLLIIFAGILLFFIGDILSNSLEILCNNFNISQFIIGILLGFVTSIPEFITFFEAQKNYKNKEEGIIEATNNLLSSNMSNLFIIQSIGIFVYVTFL